MPTDELNEHRSYWNDRVKVDRYRAAFAEVIRPGDVVLDLGCGTGLLGLLACDAGASRVYAVDGGSIIELARQIAVRNGYGDRIVHLRDMSTAISLPEQVDVVVADQIGGFAYDAGICHYYADARRFLRPGGRFVPGRLTMMLAPVCSPASYVEVEGWESATSGHDLGDVVALAANNVWGVTLGADDLMAPPAVVDDRNSDDAAAVDASVTFTVARAGTLHGLAGMFTARMSPSVRMSNVPGDADQMAGRWQNLYPVHPPVPVEVGDRLEVAVLANPVTYRVSWNVVVCRGDQELARRSHGSFLGEIVEPAALERVAADRSTVARPELDAWRTVIDAVEQGHCIGQVVAAVRGTHGALFAEPSVAERFVHHAILTLGG